VRGIGGGVGGRKGTGRAKVRGMGREGDGRVRGRDTGGRRGYPGGRRGSRGERGKEDKKRWDEEEGGWGVKKGGETGGMAGAGEIRGKGKKEGGLGG